MHHGWHRMLAHAHVHGLQLGARCVGALTRVCVSRCAHTQIACERLLNFRVELKVAGKRIGDVLNRIHIAMPKARWVQGAGLATPPATSCIAWTHMRR